MSLPAEVAEAFEYADNVANGRIAACRYVKLACERFLVDVQEAVDGISPWEFKPELAANPIILAELLPNIKGHWPASRSGSWAGRSSPSSTCSASSSVARRRGGFGRGHLRPAWEREDLRYRTDCALPDVR